VERQRNHFSANIGNIRAIAPLSIEPLQMLRQMPKNSKLCRSCQRARKSFRLSSYGKHDVRLMREKIAENLPPPKGQLLACSYRFNKRVVHRSGFVHRLVNRQTRRFMAKALCELDGVN
jgi:hypothetical protein